MRAIILSSCLLVASAAAASDGIPALKTGMAYAAARGALIAQGFRPVPSRELDETRCSAGRQDVCSAYPETISCSGTGGAECRFIFTGPKNIAVTVEAAGRDVGHLAVAAIRRSSRRDVDWQRTGH